jgi:23S rRNA pseudouridine2605 synthase
MRLNRFLASAGLGSRRSVEELIQIGHVRINGQVVTDLATKVLPTDAVKVGTRLLHQEKPLYAVLHKPAGYVCTADDEIGRRTIFDLLPETWPRVHYVGRLDMESEGLLLVTNDGDLTNILTHPRHEVEKEYELLLDKPFEAAKRAKLLRGFRIEPGFAKCERVETLRPNHLRIILRQGLKRQLRLMLYSLGYEVERLVRVRLGPIRIEELKKGEWRFLTSKEVETLRQQQPPAKAATTPAGRPAWKPATKSAKRPAWKPKRIPKAAESAPGVPALESRPFPKPSPRTFEKPIRKAGERSLPRKFEKPVGRPAAKSGDRKFKKPVGRAETESTGRPASKPFSKPARAPFAKASARTFEKPFAKPGTKPFGKTSARPERKPTGKSFGKPFAKAEGKPEGKPFAKSGAKTFNKRFDQPGGRRGARSGKS